jgi:hypothetical protein
MSVSSRTWTTTARKLAGQGELASVIVRLMMAVNDIAVANEGLRDWTSTTDPRKVHRQIGGTLYYGRMLMAHVFEALSIIEDIQTNASLRTAVEQCSAGTQAYFKAVAAFLGTDDHKVLLRIRNNAAFHYDSKLAVKALDQIAKDFSASPFKYSLGTDPLDWYFELGDMITDRIVVRDIFKAPKDADVRAAIDPILVRLHRMAAAFSDFAAYFVRQHLAPVGVRT